MVADVLGVAAARPARRAPRARISAGRAQVPGDDQGRLVVEDVAEGGGEAGEQGVELAWI